jgi:hypothetical protein
MAGGAFLVWFAYVIFLGALPAARLEFMHRNQFHPAVGSRVTSAKCFNVVLILFHTCTIEAVTPAGGRIEMTEGAVWRAPTGRVGLLVADTVPPVYATTLSLRDMNLRIASLAVAAPLAMLGLLFTLAMPFLVPWRIRRSGLSAREFFRQNDAFLRQYRARGR